jgi:hypothetical protein
MLSFGCQGRGKSAKNARKGQNPEALEEQYKKCPHSMVFHRGNVGINIRRLVKDVRRVMEPFTAINLKVWQLFEFQLQFTPWLTRLSWSHRS